MGFCLLFFVAALPAARAQVAGLSTLSVLDLPSDARSAGIGFDYVSLYDNDLNISLGNPSLITPAINNQFSLGYENMFGMFNLASAAVSRTFENIGSFTFGLKYAGYGRFEGYDEYERPTGTFVANDFLLSVGWGKAVTNRLSIGAAFKPVVSQYEAYTALAFAVDLAATYISRNQRFAATLMGRNIGAQIFTFDGTGEALPFELSLSGSYQLKEAPFRLLFALTELQTWNLRYEDPLNPTATVDAFSGETVYRLSSFGKFADNLGRHIQVGFEASISKIVFLRLGYNYRQMAEMKAADAFNSAGLSFGLGVRVKGFELSYARNNYHYMQAPNFITLSADLSRLFK